MFRKLKGISDALQSLVAALWSIAEGLQGVLAAWEAEGGLRERVDQLEMSRARWEAEIEGEMVKVESRFKAARASEERTRHLMRSNEDHEGDEEGEGALEAYFEAVAANHAQGGAPKGVQPVHQAVAPRGKDLARRFKFGG